MVGKAVRQVIEVSSAEANLVKRIRALRPCRYLVVIEIDQGGLSNVSILGEGKVEHLRQLALPVDRIEATVGNT